MRRVLFILLCLVLGVIPAPSFAATGWKSYTHPPLEMTVHYPDNGHITATGEKVKANFYLNPLQPLTNLGIKINASSLTQITFPHFALIIVRLTHIPSQVKLSAVQPQHDRDAAMCHDADYYTYYLSRHQRYYAFIFIVSNTCEQKNNIADLQKFKEMITENSI